MKAFLLLANLLLLVCLETLGTAQIPDLLILERDTLSLYSSPLEAYFSASTPRPENFGISDCSSLNCMRGYQAVWQIRHGKLFLNAILDCCFYENYVLTKDVLDSLFISGMPETALEKLKTYLGEEIPKAIFRERIEPVIGTQIYNTYETKMLSLSVLPRKSADLNEFFGKENAQDGVMADWYSGYLKVPKGELVKFIDRGYLSIFERELIIEINKGKAMSISEYDNSPTIQDPDYSLLQTTRYAFEVPRNLIPNRQKSVFLLSDTVTLTCSSPTINLIAEASPFQKTMSKNQRRAWIQNKLDSLMQPILIEYQVDSVRPKRIRCGTRGSFFAKHRNGKVNVGFFVIANLYTQLLVIYEERDTLEQDFILRAEKLIGSLRLTEFGY